MTKQERYDELERKMEAYDEASEQAGDLFDYLNDANIPGLGGLLKKIDDIKEKLEGKRDQAEEHMNNIEI